MAPVKKPSYKEGQTIMLRQKKECPWGYPAEIIQVDTDDGGITSYTVHYNGWNSRYDEVIPEDLAPERFYEWSEKAEKEAKEMQREAASIKRKKIAEERNRKSEASGSLDSTSSIYESGKRATRGKKQIYSPPEDRYSEATPAKKKIKKEAGAVYEVERVIGTRNYKGKLQYQLLWKGFDGEKTWENADDCTCEDLIQLYLDEMKPSPPKSTRRKTDEGEGDGSAGNNRAKRVRKQRFSLTEDSDNEETPVKKRKKKEAESIYEVEKVIGMRMHKGKLQYRILWKDSDGEKTWENMEDCACKDLIQRYLDKKKPSTRKSGKGEEEDTTSEEESDDEKTPSKNRNKKETDSVYEVEKVIGRRMNKGKLQYRLLWKDSEGEKTWENVEDCACEGLIQRYLEENKPSTPRSSNRKTDEGESSARQSSSNKAADVNQSASLASASHTPRRRGRPPKITGGGEGSSPGKKAVMNKPASAVTSPRDSSSEMPKFDIDSHAQILKDHAIKEKTVEELEHEELDEIFGHKVVGVVVMKKNGTEAIIQILPAGRASPLANTPLINISLPLLIKRCPKATAAYIIAVNGAVCGTIDGEANE